MKQMLNDDEMNQVVGGTVILNTSRMRIGFTYLQEAYNVVNCSDDDARDLVNELYKEYKNKGDKALEEAVGEGGEPDGLL